MLNYLLEAFEPRSRKRHIIVRLTNLHTNRSLTLLPNVGYFSDLFNVFPDRFFDGSVLVVRNTSAVRHDVPAPTHFLEANLNLRKAIANLSYTERQQEVLHRLGFTQKENGDYYIKSYQGPMNSCLSDHEVRIKASANGELTYWTRMPYPGMSWHCLDDLEPINFDNIPDFVLQGE